MFPHKIIKEKRHYETVQVFTNLPANPIKLSLSRFALPSGCWKRVLPSTENNNGCWTRTFN